MKSPKNAASIILFWIAFIALFPKLDAQTKQLKRPNSNIGVSSVDAFVTKSFDIYDKVYKYDGFAETGTPLEDEDIDSLEEARNDLEGLIDSASNILDDLDGLSILKQGKATLRINKAKKALKYSIKTSKKLLLGEKNTNVEENDIDTEDD
ncbi:hypothetical protein AAFN75_03655 [Algibacter sp. AS12]|uniref:hypothetical protein n=1 Tax=Algibacter sp. AS12 TaxID=3135773 RepID=UPI00398B3A7B